MTSKEAFIEWAMSFDLRALQSEAEVETKFIIPLFQKLGYPDGCRRDKFPIKTYNPGSRGRKPEADIVYFSVGNPDQHGAETSLIIIEAKEPKKGNLDNDVKQVSFYGYYLRPVYLVITNANGLIVLKRYAYSEETIFNGAVEALKDKSTAAYIFDQLNFNSVTKAKLTTDNITPLRLDKYGPPTPKHFVGRDAEISALLEAIECNSIVIIGGIPGIGKTYLAAEISNQLKGTYHVVWLFYDSENQLEQTLTGLAYDFERRLGDSSIVEIIRKPGTSQPEKVKAVLGLLEEAKCLLVLDGFENSDENSFLPLIIACSRQLKNGKLLITTQRWIDREDLFNAPYYLPALARLDEESGIKLMQSQGAKTIPLETLRKAYQRVDGHPKFLTLLAGLSKRFPLHTLIDELPHIPNKAQEYIKQKVFSTLEPDAKVLLEKLCILKSPFQISIIKFLCERPDDYSAFDELVSRYLVTLQSEDSQYYEIHALVREFGEKRVASGDLPTLHKQLYAYYNSLPRKLFIEARLAVHHALDAGMMAEAREAADRLLKHAHFLGMYDYILDYASDLLNDNRAKHWGIVYHLRGRAFRFKRRLAESLKNYQLALQHSNNEVDAIEAKLEIASVSILLSKESNDIDLDLAEKYYREALENAPDIQHKALALASLAVLNPEDKAIIRQMEEMLSIVEKEKNQKAIHMLCYRLAVAYKNDGETDKAISLAERTVSIQENYKEMLGENPEAYYHTYDFLARLYNESGRFTDAAKISEECVQIDRELGFEDRLAESLLRLGIDQCRAKFYADSKKILLESLPLIEKHNIQRGAKRTNYEWLTVAHWYLDEYERATEYYFDYINLCEQEGVYPKPFMISYDTFIKSNASYAEIEKLGAHILVMPSQYDESDLERWKNNITRRRPELKTIQLLKFQKGAVTDQPHSATDRKKVGRNALCPCGSGKKYKRCCGI